MGTVPDIHGTNLLEIFQEALNFRIKSVIKETHRIVEVDLPIDMESTILFL